LVIPEQQDIHPFKTVLSGRCKIFFLRPGLRINRINYLDRRMGIDENNGFKRKLGLFQSTVINMIDMVGIGPFVVLPLVIDYMGGPHFLWAWLAGALISFS
jgi:hypothetical protein